MATNSKPTSSHELSDLQKKVEWLDNERRKQVRKQAELEQQIALQEREITGREKRIHNLERQLSTISAQLNRIPQIDTQLSQFKDEIVQLIEQYDQRRLQSEREMDRLRRVEQENAIREIADIRKELPAIPRLQNDMELRVAEEARLTNLIGSQQNALSALNNQVENWEPALAFLEKKERQNSRNIADIQSATVEFNKRWEPVNEQLEVMANNVRKALTAHETVTADLEEMRENMKGWMEQIQIGEYERNQRLERWRQIQAEQSETIDQFNRDWVTFSDQYKEAKMAVQTLTGWQKQLEQQQREAAEALRLDARRLESRWDDFQLENDKKWRVFSVDTEQHAANNTRSSRQTQEHIAELEEALTQLQQEKDTIWRMQSAQADAIKQLPRIWLEEVEKAIKQNPQRRRQPALVPVREE
ncbi:MAG: hypothetical protein GY803_03080 [Chloroflexi bacterium]|nr:hypothetical protein [Chloroflexota bacterium]